VFFRRRVSSSSRKMWKESASASASGFASASVSVSVSALAGHPPLVVFLLFSEEAAAAKCS